MKKKYKSTTTDQILAQVIQAEGNILHFVCSEIHKHINSIQNKEELPKQWKESLIVPTYL
jgi:hypothetical protein